MCVGVVAAMIGLSYASVPLYRIFCQVTGFNGTPKINGEASTEVAEGSIEVRFDANVNQLPWYFRPDRISMKVGLGENTATFYHAQNNSNEALRGHAEFNITPIKAGKYFNKVECFCLTDPELKPWEKAKLGVSFFVNPKIATDPETMDVKTVTLSYTFFPSKAGPTTVAAVNKR
jgi:cytochrome c oxidase assembly protein subunit 11